MLCGYRIFHGCYDDPLIIVFMKILTQSEESDIMSKDSYEKPIKETDKKK